jgi:hypothetical protein
MPQSSCNIRTFPKKLLVISFAFEKYGSQRRHGEVEREGAAVERNGRSLNPAHVPLAGAAVFPGVDNYDAVSG